MHKEVIRPPTPEIHRLNSFSRVIFLMLVILGAAGLLKVESDLRQAVKANSTPQDIPALIGTVSKLGELDPTYQPTAQAIINDMSRLMVTRTAAAIYRAQSTPYVETKTAAQQATTTFMENPANRKDALANLNPEIRDNAVQIMFDITQPGDSPSRTLDFGSGSVIMTIPLESHPDKQVAFIFTAGHAVLTDAGLPIDFSEFDIGQPQFPERETIRLSPNEVGIATHDTSDFAVLAVIIPSRLKFSGLTYTTRQEGQNIDLLEGLGFVPDSGANLHPEIFPYYVLPPINLQPISQDRLEIHNPEARLFKGNSGLVLSACDRNNQNCQAFSVYTSGYPGTDSQIEAGGYSQAITNIPNDAPQMMEQALSKVLAAYLPPNH